MTDSEATQLGIFEAAEPAQYEAESEPEPEPEPESDIDASADRPTPPPMDIAADADHDHDEAEVIDGTDSINAHYRQDGISDVYQTLGEIAGTGYAIGNHDFVGWYRERRYPRQEARPLILSEEWGTIREKLDRVVYATISYAPTEFHMDSWEPFEWGSGGREWEYETPTPNYDDITAIAPFADIDLADDVKHDRPDGDIPKDKIEAALSQYIEAFAELASSRKHVFALDSVGGAYVMIAPSSTAPIAEHFSPADRRLIYSDMMDRLNEWLGDVRDDVVSNIPETEGTFTPDKLNNKNRLFKAPLSVHSSLNGVVTPIDPTEPSYDYTPLTAVDSDLMAKTTRWAEDYTGDHTAAIDGIVSVLWADVYDESDSWEAALATVADQLKEDEANTPSGTTADDADDTDHSQRPNPSDVDKTADKQVVFDAIDDIEPEAVVRDLCNEWNVGSRTPPRFSPGYRDSSSGTSCFVNNEGKIVDLDDSIKAMDIVTYAAREYQIIGIDDTATGGDWWQAVDELRDLGYHIPRYVGDDDISDYYGYPIAETARANDYGEPFEDDIALLRTCLRLRDDYDALSNATPPYAALVAIANVFDLLMANSKEGILGDSGYRYAREIYTELTLDNLSDELGD